MKYVWIFAIVVILVRIDVVLRFIEQTAQKVQNNGNRQMKTTEVAAPVELVPVDKDLSLKSSPKKTFLNLLNDFKSDPELGIRERALEELKNNPNMFTDKLDSELEADVYQLRNLLLQRNKFTRDLIMQMIKIMKGENLEMLRRFLTISIDTDMQEFLTFYHKSEDTNCTIMGLLADRLPEEEIYNELNERLADLDALLASTKLTDPLVKAYALKCQLVLKLQVDKYNKQTTDKEAVAPAVPTVPAEDMQVEPILVPATPDTSGQTP